MKASMKRPSVIEPSVNEDAISLVVATNFNDVGATLYTIVTRDPMYNAIKK